MLVFGLEFWILIWLFKVSCCILSFCVIGDIRFRVFLNLVNVKFLLVFIFWSIFNDLFLLNFFIKNCFLLFKLWILKCLFMMFLILLWILGLLSVYLEFVLEDWNRFFWELDVWCWCFDFNWWIFFIKYELLLLNLLWMLFWFEIIFVLFL